MDVYSQKVLETNYAYIIPRGDKAIVIDPGESLPVEKLLADRGLELHAILLTHKHWDHVNGVSDLVNKYHPLVYGFEGEDFEIEVSAFSEGEVLKILDLEIQAIHLPGHTMGACAFYMENSLFSGDVLFGGGSGRVFEGSPSDMLGSLDKIALLPDDTLIYFGHEYTKANLAFAKHVEPGNQAILDRYERCGDKTVPSNIGLEKKTNPFLRVDELSVIEAVDQYMGSECQDRVERFGVLRGWKNAYDSGE